LSFHANYEIRVLNDILTRTLHLFDMYTRYAEKRKLRGCITSVIKQLSVALVRTRTIPTERPPPVGEVSANFCGKRDVTWSAQRVPTAVNLCFLDLEPLLFHSSSSSIDLTRLSEPRSRPNTTQKSGSAGDRTRDLCTCSQKL